MVVTDFRNPFEVFWLEVLVKIEAHKHLYAETYGERLVRCHPTLDVVN